MYNLRSKENLIFLFFTVILSLFVLTEAKAFIRPANPVMDYVPQNVGIYDTYYENFKENDCRVCHGASTVERHHWTEYSLIGNCMFCHSVSPTEFEKDCKVCHVDGGPIGDFGNPHHRSDLADSDQCSQCHLHVVETNTVEPPNDVPDSTIPTPYSCENCHWPSGDVPHKPATYDGNTVEFGTDWLSWAASPKPTYWPDGIPHPQPIEANGTFRSGLLHPDKPYSPILGTHHKVSGNVFPKCNNCHASSPYNLPNWDSDNPYLIRFCENCHSMDSLHSIREHVTTSAIYTVGGSLNQTVTATEKCIACHSGNLPTGSPDIDTIPVIDSVEPNFGPPGTVVNIIPASGQCWDEDPVNGLCSFGLKMTGDKVIISKKDTQGNWNLVDVPVQSWSEHLIQIKVPDWEFRPSKTYISVHKENLGTSPSKIFIVTTSPVIYSLNPSVGSWDQVVEITGSGFTVRKEKVYENGYGYSIYFELSSLENQYRVTKYRRGNPLDTNKVLIELKDLFDINTGNPLPEQDLYEGCWNVTMIIDYFKDNPLNGTPGKYNLGMGGLDPADELLYREISNPLCFTVTKDPYINYLSSDRVPNGNTFVIYGANFGSSQVTSFIRIGKGSGLIEIIGDGIGNDDGKCTKDEYKSNGCTLDPAKAKLLKVVGWSNTKIKCDLPTLPFSLPLRAHIQVVVEGETKSNCYPFTIIEPGS